MGSGLTFDAVSDLRGRGSLTLVVRDEPIEVVMASAQPQRDFDREWAV